MWTGTNTFLILKSYLEKCTIDVKAVPFFHCLYMNYLFDESVKGVLSWIISIALDFNTTLF